MRRWCLIAALALATAAFAAGCGSSDDSSSDTTAAGGAATTSGSADSGSTTSTGGGDMAALQRIVDEARGTTTTWPGPLTSPPARRGVFVFSIPCAKVAEGCARQDTGVAAAARALGWRYATVDPGGVPDRQNAAVQQAINAGANVIILHAIDPSIVSGPLASARAKGITVICAACETDNTRDISGQVTFDPQKQGVILGAYLATASDGKANFVAFNDPEYPVVTRRWAGFQDSLRGCPDCKMLAESKFLATDIGTTLGTRAQAVLQSNPSADWAYVAFDSAATPIIQTAAQAGAQPVKVISYDGGRANIGFVRDGRQDADVGGALEWVGWAAVDDANRLLNRAPPVENPHVPSKLITRDNAAQYADTGFQGDLDYAAKYEQLWSTGRTTR